MLRDSRILKPSSFKYTIVWWLSSYFFNILTILSALLRESLGTKFKQEESFNILIAIISEKELYKFIVNNIKSVTDQKEIIYLYGCLNYINFNINWKNEREVLQIPVNNIENIIKSYNANFDIELFRENLESFNQHYKCDIFNPKRDKILRKLFFNYENNSPNLLLY